MLHLSIGLSLFIDRIFHLWIKSLSRESVCVYLLIVLYDPSHKWTSIGGIYFSIEKPWGVQSSRISVSSIR